MTEWVKRTVLPTHSNGVFLEGVLLEGGGALGIVELALIAVGLSMDAFAVSICKGLGMRRLNWRQALVIAAFFGGFQALMPVIGWALGSQFARYVEAVDHWIAFGLLALIGGKMIWDAFHDDGADQADAKDAPLNMRELLGLAVATSIDALAVGVSFAFLRVDIVPAVLFIGVVTFALSLVGVAVGHQFGGRWEKASTLAGGIVLIIIGVKILFEHLGLIAF